MSNFNKIWKQNEKKNALFSVMYLRSTLILVANTFGGCVDTWHMYRPASSFVSGFIWRRQLFGYWNVTLIRGSPLYVTFPTVSKENFSDVRFTHMTWSKTWKWHCTNTWRHDGMARLILFGRKIYIFLSSKPLLMRSLFCQYIFIHFSRFFPFVCCRVSVFLLLSIWSSVFFVCRPTRKKTTEVIPHHEIKINGWRICWQNIRSSKWDPECCVHECEKEKK